MVTSNVRMFSSPLGIGYTLQTLHLLNQHTYHMMIHRTSHSSLTLEEGGDVMLHLNDSTSMEVKPKLHQMHL